MNPASKSLEQLWYFAEGQTVHGPVAAARIKELLQNGTLTGQSLVVEEGQEEWKTLEHAGGLSLTSETSMERVEAPETGQHPDPEAAPAQSPRLSESRPRGRQSRKQGAEWQILAALGWLSSAIIGVYGESPMWMLAAFIFGWAVLAYVGRKEGCIMAVGASFLLAIVAMGIVISIGQHFRPSAKEPAIARLEPEKTPPVETLQSSNSGLTLKAFRTAFNAQAAALKMDAALRIPNLQADEFGTFKVVFDDALSIKGEIDPLSKFIQELTIKGQAGDDKLFTLPALLIAVLQPNIDPQERDKNVQILVKGTIENAALIHPAEPPRGTFGKWNVYTSWLNSSKHLSVIIRLGKQDDEFPAPVSAPPAESPTDPQLKDEFMILFRQLQGFRDGSSPLNPGLSFDEWTQHLNAFISKAAATDKPDSTPSRIHFAAMCLQTMAMDYKRANGKETYASFKTRENIESNLGTSEVMVSHRMKADFDAILSGQDQAIIGGVPVKALGDLIEGVVADERINLDLALRVLFPGGSVKARLVSYDPNYLYYVTPDSQSRGIPFAIKRTPDIEDLPTPGYSSKVAVYEDLLMGNASEFDPLRKGYVMVTGTHSMVDLSGERATFAQYSDATSGKGSTDRIENCRVLCVRVIHLSE